MVAYAVGRASACARAGRGIGCGAGQEEAGMAPRRAFRILFVVLSICALLGACAREERPGAARGEGLQPIAAPPFGGSPTGFGGPVPGLYGGMRGSASGRP
jgi:hypothetical protein